MYYNIFIIHAVKRARERQNLSLHSWKVTCIQWINMVYNIFFIIPNICIYRKEQQREEREKI